MTTVAPPAFVADPLTLSEEEAAEFAKLPYGHFQYLRRLAARRRLGLVAEMSPEEKAAKLAALTEQRRHGMEARFRSAPATERLPS